jgi:hypothetical protein
MAQRVDGFKKAGGDAPRRYPWPTWMDESVWEIRMGEDYDVPTENMRVNLHERAKRDGCIVRTEKVVAGKGEGLRFQFERPVLESPRDRRLRRVGDPGPGHRGMPR